MTLRVQQQQQQERSVSYTGPAEAADPEDVHASALLREASNASTLASIHCYANMRLRKLVLLGLLLPSKSHDGNQVLRMPTVTKFAEFSSLGQPPAWASG